MRRRHQSQRKSKYEIVPKDSEEKDKRKTWRFCLPKIRKNKDKESKVKVKVEDANADADADVEFPIEYKSHSDYKFRSGDKVHILVSGNKQVEAEVSHIYDDTYTVVAYGPYRAWLDVKANSLRLIRHEHEYGGEKFIEKGIEMTAIICDHITEHNLDPSENEKLSQSIWWMDWNKIYRECVRINYESGISSHMMVIIHGNGMIHFSKDYEQEYLMKYLQKSIDYGCTHAKAVKASYDYANGKPYVAAKLYEELIEDKVVAAATKKYAYYHLGTMYANHTHDGRKMIKKDHDMAEKLLKKAIDMGVGQAVTNLAELYYDSSEIISDKDERYKKAMNCLKSSSCEGVMQTKINITRKRYAGNCYPVDRSGLCKRIIELEEKLNIT